MWQWTQWGGCAFTMHGASIVHQSSAMYQKYCWYVLTWYMIQLEQYLPKCTFNFTFFKTVILKTLLLLLYYRTLIKFYSMLNKLKIEPKFWLPIFLITTSETYFEIKKNYTYDDFFSFSFEASPLPSSCFSEKHNTATGGEKLGKMD